MAQQKVKQPARQSNCSQKLLSCSHSIHISKPGGNAFTPAGLLQAIGGARGSDVPFKDDGLVTRWNIVGDTGGDDNSTDNNPHDDTQVAVQLNPVTIKLRRLPGKLKPVNVLQRSRPRN